MKRVKTIQLPINPSIPVISLTPYLENKLTNKPLGENAETYVKAPIYEGITKGKIVSENNNFEPGNSYLTVRIDINNPRNKLVKIFSVSILCLITCFGTIFTYDNILKNHQRNYIKVWLNLEKDPNKIKQMEKTILYNINESKKAISSGGLTGKGYLKGTRTMGNFVPAQHSDYIFSTVGEEWGFIGSTFIIMLYTILIIRIIYLSENQKNKFSRVFGYCTASILFIHFLINIGMVLGLTPTIGIPLPFLSYGGSSLIAFTILLSIFLRLDGNKINEW